MNLIILSALLLSLNPLISKYYIIKSDLINFVLYKLVICGLIGIIGLIIYNYKEYKPINTEVLIPLCLVSLLSVLYISIHYYEITHKEISYVSTITKALNILFTFILAIYLYNEKINVSKCLGLILILLGIYLLNRPHSH